MKNTFDSGCQKKEEKVDRSDNKRCARWKRKKNF